MYLKMSRILCCPENWMKWAILTTFLLVALVIIGIILYLAVTECIRLFAGSVSSRDDIEEEVVEADSFGEDRLVENEDGLACDDNE